MKTTVLFSLIFFTLIVNSHVLETDAIIADEIDTFVSFGFAADLDGQTEFSLNGIEIKIEFYKVHAIESRRQFVAISSDVRNNQNNENHNPRAKMPTCENGILNDSGWGICGGGDLGHVEFNIRMARVAAIEFCSRLPDSISLNLVPYYTGPDSFSGFNDYGFPVIAEFHHDSDVVYVGAETLYSIDDGISFKCAFNIGYDTTY